MTGNGCISFYQSSMNQNYHQKLCLHLFPFRFRYKQCAFTDLSIPLRINEPDYHGDWRAIPESLAQNKDIQIFTKLHSNKNQAQVMCWHGYERPVR